MNEKERRKWNEAALKELAARLLAKAIKRTPVGDYSKNLFVDTKNKRIKYASFQKSNGERVTFRIKSVKKGGALRRGWTGGEKMPPQEYANRLTVTKSGDIYTISNADYQLHFFSMSEK